MTVDTAYIILQNDVRKLHYTFLIFDQEVASSNWGLRLDKVACVFQRPVHLSSRYLVPRAFSLFSN